MAGGFTQDRDGSQRPEQGVRRARAPRGQDASDLGPRPGRADRQGRGDGHRGFAHVRRVRAAACRGRSACRAASSSCASGIWCPIPPRRSSCTVADERAPTSGPSRSGACVCPIRSWRSRTAPWAGSWLDSRSSGAPGVGRPRRRREAGQRPRSWPSVSPSRTGSRSSQRPSSRACSIAAIGRTSWCSTFARPRNTPKATWWARCGRRAVRPCRPPTTTSPCARPRSCSCATAS